MIKKYKIQTLKDSINVSLQGYEGMVAFEGMVFFTEVAGAWVNFYTVAAGPGGTLRQAALR